MPYPFASRISTWNDISQVYEMIPSHQFLQTFPNQIYENLLSHILANREIFLANDYRTTNRSTATSTAMIFVETPSYEKV